MSDRPYDQGGQDADDPPSGRRTRTGLMIGVIAAALVVVAGLAVGLVALLSDDPDQPSATVQTYLQALADGDARSALDQAATAPDTTFLTSDALQAQQRIARITSISVRDTSHSSTRARVSATYRFGDRQADEAYSLTRLDGHWRLDAVVYPIDLTGLGDVPGLTLLGIATAGRNRAYVFPGPLVWGSANTYLQVGERNSDDFTLSPTDDTHASSSLETGLSDDGRKAVTRALGTYVAGCAKSRNLAPRGCPQSEYDYDGVDGTATWKAPTDLSRVQSRPGSPVTRVSVSGDLTWSVTYTSKDGNGVTKTVTDNAVDGPIYGTVDLTEDPPVLSP